MNTQEVGAPDNDVARRVADRLMYEVGERLYETPTYLIGGGVLRAVVRMGSDYRREVVIERIIEAYPGKSIPMAPLGRQVEVHTSDDILKQHWQEIQAALGNTGWEIVI